MVHAVMSIFKLDWDDSGCMLLVDASNAFNSLNILIFNYHVFHWLVFRSIFIVHLPLRRYVVSSQRRGLCKVIRW